LILRVPLLKEGRGGKEGRTGKGRVKEIIRKRRTRKGRERKKRRKS